MVKKGLGHRINRWLRAMSTKLVILLKYKWFCLRVPKDINLYVKRWNSIDRRRDKSLSAKDFRLWYYLRKMDEWKGKSTNER